MAKLLMGQAAQPANFVGTRNGLEPDTRRSY